MNPVRKLLTKPIWWYERRRRYPIREAVFNLPARAVSSGSGACALAVLATPNNLSDASWTAFSIMDRLPAEMGLTVVIDGCANHSDVLRLNRLFPGLIMRSTAELMEEARPLIPNVAALGKHHPLGRKLAAILLLQRQHSLIYSDSDVLCFGDMPEVCKSVEQHGPALYLQEASGLNADPAVLRRASSLDMEAAENLNSGFLYIPQNSLDFQTAEMLLADQQRDHELSWFVEQTIIAVLMRQAKAQPLPLSKYLVSSHRQWYFEPDVDYTQIALRHFVTPVRHIMYLKGLPYLHRRYAMSTH
jgi:hypothetical protein